MAGNNNVSRGQQRDKPFRDALRMEAALADKGEPSPAKPGSLRFIARAMLERAAAETAAAREVGDRLDGKPAQAVEMSGGLSLSHEDALEQLDRPPEGNTAETAGQSPALRSEVSEDQG
jgi:hypothetical protein